MAATMLKVDVAGLTQYSRVLYLDLDMLPRERAAAEHLEWEYEEGLVAFPGPTTPVSGQLFVIRPDAKMHQLLRHLAETRANNFSVARGWAGSGLLTWPAADASNARAQCNTTAMQNGLNVHPAQGRRRCALWPFWIRRCQQHGLTSWNFMHAGSDQGVLWYAYNLSGVSSVRSLTAKPLGPKGHALPLGLQYWVHLQGTCKPWLVSRQTLRRSKCCCSG